MGSGLRRYGKDGMLYYKIRRFMRDFSFSPQVCVPSYRAPTLFCFLLRIRIRINYMEINTIRSSAHNYL